MKTAGCYGYVPFCLWPFTTMALEQYVESSSLSEGFRFLWSQFNIHGRAIHSYGLA